MEKRMNKFDEIALLKSLRGDTYFAQYFGEDIDTMCGNIENDFPIEMGCRFNEKAEEMRKAAEDAKATAFEERKITVEKIIRYGEPEWDSELYHYCASLCGPLFIIETKRSIGQELFDEEVDYLINAVRSTAKSNN